MLLEGEMNGRDELHELRSHVLLPLSESARTALERPFRIETGVLRPRVQIAAGNRDRRATGAERRGEAFRKRVGKRNLAKLHEAGVVDDVAVQLTGRLCTQRRELEALGIPVGFAQIEDVAAH